MDINDKHSSAVQYKGFIFDPHFDIGQRNATFHLLFTSDKCEKVTKITSPVSNIYHINNQVYIETKNSLYQLLGTVWSLDKVERYLTNPNLTSEEFFNKYVPNLPPTEHGWRIF